jgi:hypothetical protein
MATLRTQRVFQKLARLGGIARSSGGPHSKPLNYWGHLMPKSRINPTDKHVGSRLRMRRLMLDMSQTDVADASA